MTYSDGNIYDGEWNDNSRHGQGKMTYPSGEIYIGAWKDNKKNGNGKMTYSNGNIYEGEWVNSEMNGQGKMTFPDGETHTGIWKDDKLVDNIQIHNKKYKPDAIKSSQIREQQYGDCWAHAISRNFLRTLQILNVIKSNYVEQFYDLFYTILTMSREDCNEGGNAIQLVILYNYLRDNYICKIFTIKYKDSKSNNEYFTKDKLDQIILQMSLNDKTIFIKDMKYLFNDK